jgi:hypothetical protein
LTTFGALIVIFLSYYFSMRGLVRILAFPGIVSFFRRSMELNFGKSMAMEVVKSIMEFKNGIEIYLTQN